LKTKSRAQCCATLFLWHGVAPVARRWSVNGTTTWELGCTVRALTSATGAFLFERLASTTADFRANLNLLGTGAATSALPVYNFPEEVLANFCAEDRVVELKRARLLVFKIKYVNIHLPA